LASRTGFKSQLRSFSLFISPQPSDARIHVTIADLSYELANSTLSSVAHNYAKPPLDVSGYGSGCFLFLVAHRIRPFCGKMRTNLRKLLVVPRPLTGNMHGFDSWLARSFFAAGHVNWGKNSKFACEIRTQAPKLSS